jgi:hypothetical protein
VVTKDDICLQRLSWNQTQSGIAKINLFHAVRPKYFGQSNRLVVQDLPDVPGDSALSASRR